MKTFSPDRYWLATDAAPTPAGPLTVDDLRVMRPQLKGTKPKVCREGSEEWVKLAEVLGPVDHVPEWKGLVLGIAAVAVIIVGSVFVSYTMDKQKVDADLAEDAKHEAAMVVRVEEARLQAVDPAEYKRQRERRLMAEEIAKAMKK